MGGGTALNPDKIIMLKDGDIIGTERNSYIYDIQDPVKDNENDSTDIMVYPKSEMRLRVKEKTANPPKMFMDPSQVPEAMNTEGLKSILTGKARFLTVLKNPKYAG